MPLELERHQDADLAQVRRDRAMHIIRHDPGTDRERGGAAQRDVLADRRDGGGNRNVHGLVAGARRLDRVDVGPDRERDVGDRLHQALELLIAGDEIRLGIDFDHHALVVGNRDADQAFSRDSAGLLGRLGEALLAQPVDRCFHLAPGLAERGLAVHHARAGLVAELLHHRGGNVGHVVLCSPAERDA